MKEQLVLGEIHAAKNAIADAEGDLAQLLSEIQVASRADKTTISEAMQNAFHKLRAARQHLVALEKLARGEDP
jgi:hypothetical protein